MKKFKKCAGNVYANEIPYNSKELNERFTYKKGKLYHLNYRDRCSRGPNMEGVEAGRKLLNGRCQVRIDYSLYYRSRLIYKMLNGNDPVGVLDHIDNDCTNDKIGNLQDVTQTYNRWYKSK
tara:strand:+ start:92 stop:454 length:363 start_codon:yes stop_codon:yes gene_type:complete